jgi:glutamate dehydrogenase
LRRIALRRAELSSVLRVLESFGLVAEEAVPWHIELGGPREGDAFVDDVGLRVGTPVAAPGFRLSAVGPQLIDALIAATEERSELSSLNRLVVGAALGWRDVNLLRSYCAYRQAVGGPRADDRAELLAEALVRFPSAAAAALSLFRARLEGQSTGDNPGAGRPEAEGTPSEDEDSARAEVYKALASVPDRAHDEVLRELVALVDATTRSSWSLDQETIALKLASAPLPFLPLPRPLVETFVWSPTFEGLHLRFGLVARGGVRWSERRSDLRGEVLGLARAQVKKNALIVPTGAKGAFVLHDDPSHPDEPGERARRGRQAYSAFVGALLDVTDNVVNGELVHPKGIVCRDGDDPYLVVAPDKGTADFSDMANEISCQRGFWLGDAFASGGSNGYDHKALGITARGAWWAVRRHFRALGMDVQNDPVRVVGVGDMSGDVFGNAMLQSTAICLVAAFDHRDIFVDPVPSPEISFAERQRLSYLGRSSWNDYDLRRASPGAAVYSRRAKQIEISDEVGRALGLSAGPLSPPELLRAVLLAPVDLIFFGGIGTFVKARDETDIEVDDRANDEVRVDASQLRARVVAEGANLALTQRARIAYARRGGRVNTDFVDNSAGVAMSDREVNLKILLDVASVQGRLTKTARDQLLKHVEDAVAEAVLAQVGRGLVALDEAAAASSSDLGAFEALQNDLEQAGSLNPEVESLPGPEELARRKQAGAGLSRPELAVLFAYARSELARSVESSDLVTEPALAPCILRYFPPAVAGPLADLVPGHPLARQLLSCELANEIVDRMGAVWAHELAAYAGRPAAHVAGAYWAARQVLGSETIFEELDRSAWAVSVPAELAVRARCQAALDRAARWYLSRGASLSLGATMAEDAAVASTLRAGEEALSGAEADLVGLGVPPELAAPVGRLTAAAGAAELAAVTRASGQPVARVLEVYRAVDEALYCPLLLDAMAPRSVPDRWERTWLMSLSDDLVRARASAATDALASGGGGSPANDIEHWRQPREAALQRLALLVGQVRAASPAPSLALLSLAVRAAGDVLGDGTGESD